MHRQEMTQLQEIVEQSKEKLLVSSKTAARMLSVSPRKFWGMTFEDDPGVPYVRVGRLVRYSVSDLEKWIAQRRQGGAR